MRHHNPNYAFQLWNILRQFSQFIRSAFHFVAFYFKTMVARLGWCQQFSIELFCKAWFIQLYGAQCSVTLNPHPIHLRFLLAKFRLINFLPFGINLRISSLLRLFMQMQWHRLSEKLICPKLRAGKHIRTTYSYCSFSCFTQSMQFVSNCGVEFSVTLTNMK